MSSEEFDQILKHTLRDYRVSRGEKRVLKSVLDEMNADSDRMAFLRSRAFEIARNEVMSPGANGVLDWLEDVVKVLQPRIEPEPRQAEAHFSPGTDCMAAINGWLRRARKSVDICVFTITDNRIADEIREAHARRIKVRIITDNDKAEDLGSDVDAIAGIGVPVRVDKTSYHMHHKFAVIDDATLITGSYNWTRSAAEYNEENIVVCHDRPLVRQFSTLFEDLWKELG